MLERISSQSGSALSHTSSEQADQHKLEQLQKAQAQNLSSLQIFNAFMRVNADAIQKDLLKVENEALYRAFYHVRWFH